MAGGALVHAAGKGHTGVVRTLLGWPEHAPHADCRNSEALVMAAGKGHEVVVRTLLSWPEHAVSVRGGGWGWGRRPW